jgi:hypothetical protein
MQPVSGHSGGGAATLLLRNGRPTERSGSIGVGYRMDTTFAGNCQLSGIQQ